MSDVTATRSPELDGAIEMMQFIKDGGSLREVHKLQRELLHERASAALAGTERATRLNSWIDMSARRRISGHQSDSVSKYVTGRQRVLPFPTEHGDFELVLTNVFLKSQGEAYESADIRIVLCDAGTSDKPIMSWYDQGITLAEFHDLPGPNVQGPLFTDHRDVEALLTLFE